MLRVALLALISISTCQKDETLTGYGAGDTIWILKTIDGQPFNARATITFPEEGSIAGDAPCNSYFGAQTAPYPWFKAENIAATKRACPDLQAEIIYLNALSDVSISEISGTILILSNDAGLTMEFHTD